MLPPISRALGESPGESTGKAGESTPHFGESLFLARKKVWENTGDAATDFPGKCPFYNIRKDNLTKKKNDVMRFGAPSLVEDGWGSVGASKDLGGGHCPFRFLFGVVRRWLGVAVSLQN